ncbi:MULTISPECIES: hypothetical protein [unclassified Bradyrhizobium]|uniref:hypothetical protein n=1 Tax=unclassified Bradyrhizobium TaxID=2631580 RepID=UPI0024791DDC|nr:MULTISPECIES: hypothetical protein [unclassified Bradyrhizobium]WGS17328.1 hypothetical protein MTX22_21920 [Bradyrhizobium sp. ISRA463]WGS31066.1 hypothetical protein MTX19_19595 [Bradyrhizobium sp. ISRA464]
MNLASRRIAPDIATKPTRTYLLGMPITRKLIEIPPEVARQFVADMEAYHSERDSMRRDEIAGRTRHTLLGYMPAGSELRLREVKETSSVAGMTVQCILRDDTGWGL